jgi:protein TonB
LLSYSKRFLFYGFAISLLLHAVFGPFVEWKPQIAERPEPDSSITVTTAPPKPTPPPAPTPLQTPQPQTTAPHRVARFIPRPPKTTTQSAGSESEQKSSSSIGSPNGVPEGNANTGAPATVVAMASPAPTPTKPACAVPNSPASATEKATPETPETARQMGVSGTAQIKVNLDTNGDVVSASILTSTHNGALDKAALQAALQSKYSPEIDNCVKTSGSYLYIVTFESQP